MSQDTRIGTEIAGYTIQSLLGRGGMSVVYLATQSFPARKAALKLLAPELVDEPGFRERFIRESNAAASLDHPNVIPIYGAGDDSGVLWIAMRYVEGTDLARLISDEGALPPERTVHIVEQVASALDAAHEIGLVHRDVKPGNILLARSDHAYLTDFGITKRREAGTEFTKTGDFLGTVDYAAPEQIRGEPVDGRADVYSLGCMTYECLTGEPPFHRESEVAVMYAHLEEIPPRPTAVRPEFPPAIDDVLAEAMAKDPAARYATAGALASGVRTGLAPAPVAAPSPTTTRPQPPDAPRRRGRVVAALLALALVAAGIITLVVVRSNGNPGVAGSPSAISTVNTPNSPAGTGTPAAIPTGVHGVAELNQRTGHVTATTLQMSIPGGASFGRPLLAAEGAIWISDGGNPPHLLKIDPRTSRPESTVLLSHEYIAAVALAAASTSVWALPVTANESVALIRIDPGTDKVAAKIGLPTGGAGIAASPDGLWIARTDGAVQRVDTDTNRLEHPIQAGPNASGLAAGAGYLWVADNVAGAVYRVDPATGTVRNISLPGGADGVAADSSGAWVLDRQLGSVTQINPDGSIGVTVRVGPTPNSITAGQGAIWVADPEDGTVWQVDEVTQQATSFPIAKSPGPSWVAVGEGGVWATLG